MRLKHSPVARLQSGRVSERRSGGAGLLIVLVLAAGAAVVASWSDLFRAGYSPDEEFTLFAVRGISASRLPLLPSGLLYDRGLAYSYAAWLAGLVAGESLPAFRLVSLGSSAMALAVLWREVRRFASASAAALAVIAVALSLPFWVSATTARFYAPFLLCYLVTLALLSRERLSWREAAGLALGAAAARWTHELGFTLAIVPAAVVVLARGRAQRIAWIRRTALVVAGLVAGQLAIFVVHALAPPANGDVMVRRFFLWQVLNLFEQPPLALPRALPVAALAGAVVAAALALVRARVGPRSAALVAVGGTAAALGQLGLAPALAIACLPLVSAELRRGLALSGAAVGAAGVAFWMVAFMAGGLAAGDAWARVSATGFVYPLDMFGYLVRESPVLTVSVLAALLTRAAGLGGAWPVEERALHALWIGWVSWFGVIESGITQRYLLLPETFMLSALAVDLAALCRPSQASRRRAALALALTLLAAVSVESWFGPRGAEHRAAAARPTLHVESLASHVLPDDLVVSHDELACMLAAGRIDAWLALDGFFRERFIVRRGGAPTGTYTGVPAADELLPLLQRAEREQRRLVVVDVLKDVPGFGSTAALLTTALARENLRGEVLAESGGARLVRIVRPQAQARLSH